MSDNDICVLPSVRHAEGVTCEYMQLLFTWMAKGIRVRPIEGFEGYVEYTRARQVHEFLSTDSKYMLMMDDDILPLLVDAPQMLAGHDLPIVSGVCVTGSAKNPNIRACFRLVDGTVPLLAEHDFPRDKPFEVMWAGTGFLMVRRDVVEQMGPEAFLVPQDRKLKGMREGLIDMGTDVAFGLACREAGIKTYIDPGVLCRHDKPFPLVWQWQEQLQTV